MAGGERGYFARAREEEIRAEAERRREEERRRRAEEKKTKGPLATHREAERRATNQSRGFNAIFVAVLIAISLFHPFVKPLKQFFMEILSIAITDIADYYEWVYRLGSFLVIVLAAWNAYNTNSPVIGIAWFIITFLLITGFAAVDIYLESAWFRTYFFSVKCTIQNLGDPEGMGDCQTQYINIEEPEPVKIGEYGVKATFDTEFSGNVVHKNKTHLVFNTYFLNVDFKNPSDKNTINNFKIITHPQPGKVDEDDRDEYLYEKDTAIVRSGAVKTREKIKLANLYEVDRLCMDEACSIEPEDTLRLVFRAEAIRCEDILDSTYCEVRDTCEWEEDEYGDIEGAGECKEGEDWMTTEVEARVRFSYDYTGEGKFDFIVAGSDEVLRPQLANRANPTSSDGPLDVIVYFAPSAYVFRGPRIEPEAERPKVNVMIKLLNSKGGTAYIKDNISITWLKGGVIERKVEGCAAPWGGYLTFQDEKYKNIDHIDLEGREWTIPSSKSHTYVCEYEIGVDLDEDEYETVPFIVSTNYRYEKTAIRKVIPVEELMG